MTLPTWMRRALYATAVMNLLAAIAFLPAGRGLRALVAMPLDAPAIYLATVSLFVFLFAVGYLWTAVTGEANVLFITLAAAGKLTFFALLVGYWALGALPIGAPLSGMGDLVFGVLFVVWLLSPQAAVVAGARRTA